MVFLFRMPIVMYCKNSRHHSQQYRDPPELYCGEVASSSPTMNAKLPIPLFVVQKKQQQDLHHPTFYVKHNT